jgi:hypothetical protein
MSKPYAAHREETNFELFVEGLCVKYGVAKPVAGERVMEALEKIRDLLEKMDDIIEERQ